MPPGLDSSGAQAGTSRGERLAVGGALALLAVPGWAFTWHQAHMMEHMDHAAMRQPSWTALDASLLLVMWVVMMVAMMTPAVAPMVLAFAAINRRRRREGAPWVATGVFLAGYLLAWGLFSVLATAVQLALHELDLLDPMMEATSRRLTAALLVAAGLYQWSPLKGICLARCRSTAGFILSAWRDGATGALVMGWRHGLWCLGCCALLMLLLFAVGVMDLRWVVALTALVAAEKLLPRPELVRRAAGAALIAAGVYVLVRP